MQKPQMRMMRGVGGLAGERAAVCVSGAPLAWGPDAGAQVETADLNACAESTALYIAQMANELAKLARFTRLDVLTYLLDMARLEAETYAHDAVALELPLADET